VVRAERIRIDYSQRSLDDAPETGHVRPNNA